MGVCVHNITLDGPPLPRNTVMNLDTGFVWVCIRREKRQQVEDDGKTASYDWYIQGIASDEETAIDMCRDEMYFIGPLPFNAALPHKAQEWVGAYYPLRKKTPDNACE